MSLLDVIEDHAHPGGDDGRYRYFGFQYGRVTNISDDLGLGRIKAKIGAQGDSEETEWLVPFWPGSIECIPNEKDLVLVGFVDGDPHRGFYGWHPATTTQKRPTEAMVLGTTLAGMYNDLAAKVSTLISKYNQLNTDVNTLFQLVNITGLTDGSSIVFANPTVSKTASADSDSIGKIQDANGSTVGAKSGDNIALSGKTRLR